MGAVIPERSPVNLLSLELPAQAEGFRRQIAELTIFALALLMLLVGSPLGDDRLVFAGIPVAAVIFLAGAWLVLGIQAIRAAAIPVVAFMLPIALLGVALFWSVRPEYGAFKFFNLLVVVLVVLPMLQVCIVRMGIRRFCRVWIALMLLLLLAAILWKVRFGFFDREVTFFMNGPIVFGRLMGTAAVLSIFAFDGRKRIALFFLFSLAVVWPMSKGPILGLIGAMVIVVLFMMKGRRRLEFIVSLLGFGGLLLYLAWDLVSAFDWGRLAVFLDLLTSRDIGSSANFGSVGARLMIFVDTLDLIKDHPLGVGLGSWSFFVENSLGLDYPHSLPLELWAECGIVLGTIGLLPFLAFFLPGPPPLRACALFLFIAQLVSGDLLDARYLLAFAFLTAFNGYSRQLRTV